MLAKALRIISSSGSLSMSSAVGEPVTQRGRLSDRTANSILSSIAAPFYPDLILITCNSAAKISHFDRGGVERGGG